MNPPRPKAYRYSVLTVVCLSASLVPFMGSSVNLALPHIAADLSMNAVALGWVITSFLLASAIFQIPLGKVGDMFGRKKILTIGVSLFSISSLACAFTPSGHFLIAARFIQGFASAMLFGVSMAIITSVFPANERGKALGINTAVVYFSIAVGPFIGGILTHYFGWRSIFFVSTGMGLLTLLGILLYLKGEWIEAKGEKFDWTGMFIYAVGLSALIYGCSTLPSISGSLMIVAGIILFVFFTHYEKRRDTPMFNMNMFLSNRVFRMSSFAALINYAATFAIGFMLSLYLQYIKGFDAQKAGFILIAQPIIQTIISPLAGRWSDKVNAGKIATLGMAVIVLCLLAMLFLQPDTHIGYLILILLFLGVGFGLFSSPNVNVIMGSVETRFLGMASATTGTMRLTGQSISMGITMMMISIFIGKTQITADVYPLFMKCLRYTFGILTVVCALGVYTSLVRSNPSTGK
ncbi:MAG: MFS transporter [Bacteroidales bacterium]|jgi:EmrB/QacA subfamily drug resistance transporter|nr:MFS transporter [Bacteroidales bacterium]